MNGAEIYSILKAYLSPKCYFAGVFARDCLPSFNFSRYPACLVSNTDVSGQKGQHWVSFYFPSPGYIEYFDSYALPPFAYGFSLTPRIQNSVSFQDYNSSVCGQYCIFFLIMRSNNFNMHLITSSFSKKTKEWNDSKVALYVYKNFPIKNPILSHALSHMISVSQKAYRPPIKDVHSISPFILNLSQSLHSVYSRGVIKKITNMI